MAGETIETLWGEGDTSLSLLQMGIRAFVTFIVALALIRLAGRRSFGLKSPFDNTFTILLGAILAKAVIGDISYASGLLACTVLALTHRLFGYLSAKYSAFGSWVKGDKLLVFEDGKFNEKSMLRAQISENDFMERMRMNGIISLEEVKAAFMERNGEISFIRK